VFNLLAQKIRLQTCSFKEQIMVKNVRWSLLFFVCIISPISASSKNS
jgi:hypothetical protein